MSVLENMTMKHSTFEFVGNGQGINGSSWAKSVVAEFEPEFNVHKMLVNAPTEFHIARAIGLKVKGFTSVFEEKCMGATFFFKK